MIVKIGFGDGAFLFLNDENALHSYGKFCFTSALSVEYPLMASDYIHHHTISTTFTVIKTTTKFDSKIAASTIMMDTLM